MSQWKILITFSHLYTHWIPYCVTSGFAIKKYDTEKEDDKTDVLRSTAQNLHLTITCPSSFQTL